MITAINILALVVGIVMVLFGIKAFINWQIETNLPVKNCFEHYFKFLESKYNFLTGRPYSSDISPEDVRSIYLISLLAFGSISRIIVGLFLIVYSSTDVLN